jgi:hypothetical protein
MGKHSVEGAVEHGERATNCKALEIKAKVA